MTAEPRFDLLFTGADAARVARDVGAGDFGAGEFGWRDGAATQVQVAVGLLLDQQFRHRRRFTYELVERPT